jgi:FKBP-type peptidyl-prolyl cis-trans isomerase SlyD
MIIENNKVVSLTYELRADGADGALIQKVEADQPFAFLFGHNNVIRDFETNLKGKTTGDTFSFSIDSANAYGPILDEAVVELSREIFAFEDQEQEAEMLRLGNTIPMMDQNGNRLEGIVLEVADEFVKMDFNHPLAGVNLHFSGEILAIRGATESELTHGHAHDGDGHHHHH